MIKVQSWFSGIPTFPIRLVSPILTAPGLQLDGLGWGELWIFLKCSSKREASGETMLESWQKIKRLTGVYIS